jgi:hypothetical protein
LTLSHNSEKPRPQNLNKLLEKLGFQFREDDLWKATEKGKEFADFVQNKSQYSEKRVFNTVWKKEILGTNGFSILFHSSLELGRDRFHFLYNRTLI